MKRTLKVIDLNFPFTYASGLTPKTYRCGKCGATGIKLWRSSSFVATHVDLRCCDCAGKQEGKEARILTINADGKMDYYYHTENMGKTDQIGSFMPAVPTEQNDTFWSYTSVPEAGCIWWRQLPNRISKAERMAGERAKSKRGSTRPRYGNGFFHGTSEKAAKEILKAGLRNKKSLPTGIYRS